MFSLSAWRLTRVMNQERDREAALLRREHRAFVRHAQRCAARGDHAGFLVRRALARNCALMVRYLYDPPTSTFSHLDHAWDQIRRLRVPRPITVMQARRQHPHR